MSSTNRGGDRQNDDFYSTPAWVTQALLPRLALTHDGPWRDVLDPCCGDGAILDCFGNELTVGIELDEARAVAAHAKGHLITVADALIEPWPVVQLIITNPPFSLAEEFVRRAIGFAAESGATVAMLLRLAFLESSGRAPLHREFPSDVYPLSSRPSFTPDGKTDSCAYAWFVWDMARNAAVVRKVAGPRIHVLDEKPPPRPRIVLGRKGAA